MQNSNERKRITQRILPPEVKIAIDAVMKPTTSIDEIGTAVGYLIEASAVAEQGREEILTLVKALNDKVAVANGRTGKNEDAIVQNQDAIVALAKVVEELTGEKLFKSGFTAGAKWVIAGCIALATALAGTLGVLTWEYAVDAYRDNQAKTILKYVVPLLDKKVDKPVTP